MDFGLTEEQVELAGLTRKILAERDAPWGDLAAAGVLAAGLPAALDGVLVFLVAPTDAGVRVEPQGLTDFASAGRVVLSGVTLGDDRVLAGDGQGAGVADWLVARATVGLCAVQSGVIERALELTAEYAKSRVAFGRPIGSFQAVTQRLADAYVDVEAVRLTRWQAAWGVGSGSA